MLSVAGCDWTDTETIEEQVVVESYLLAGGPLPSVRLTRSVSVSGSYSPSAQAVQDASVRVHRVDDAGAVAETHTYRSSRVERSVYVPEQEATVVPRATYRLEVTLDSGESVTSSTVVPDTLSIVSVSADTAVYNEEQIEWTLTRSEYPGRQAYVIFTSEALEASISNATPTTLRLLDQDEDLSIDEIRITSSPALSESTYLNEQSGLLEIPIPWLGIRFYGGHTIRISAVDDNLYDFLRSQLVQQGGSTFLPGEVPNILDRVNGGTGVFGSYATAAALVYVARGAQ